MSEEIDAMDVEPPAENAEADSNVPSGSLFTTPPPPHPLPYLAFSLVPELYSKVEHLMAESKSYSKKNGLKHLQEKEGPSFHVNFLFLSHLSPSLRSCGLVSQSQRYVLPRMPMAP